VRDRERGRGGQGREERQGEERGRVEESE